MPLSAVNIKAPNKSVRESVVFFPGGLPQGELGRAEEAVMEMRVLLQSPPTRVSHIHLEAFLTLQLLGI